MTEAKSKGTRAGAIARARSYVESGAFEADLARRVAFKTESQLLPASLPELRRYLDEEMAPAFQRLGFTTRIYDNPLPGQGPVLLATRIEDARLPTVLGYGHGDVIRGLEDQWTKGKGPWVTARDGERLYGRGTADNKGQHTINMAALDGGAGRARRAARLQCQVHHRDGRGGGLQGAGRAGRRPQGGLRRRRAGRLRRPAREAGAPDHDAGLPRRHQLRSRLRPARGRASLRQLGRADRQPGHHPRPCAGVASSGPRASCWCRRWRRRPCPRRSRSAWPTSRSTAARPGRAVDAWWGEPGLTPAERVYASNVFNVLAFTTGTPGRPVNAIPPKAVANCQLRFVAGTDVDDDHAGAAARISMPRASRRVKVMPPPAVNDGRFAATRTEPDHPWAQFVAASLQRSANAKPAMLPQTGGSICNDVFTDILGMPTIWIPHSYAVVLPARARRAHPDAADALGHRADGRALLGHRRGQDACQRGLTNRPATGELAGQAYPAQSDGHMEPPGGLGYPRAKYERLGE